MTTAFAPTQPLRCWHRHGTPASVEEALRVAGRLPTLGGGVS